MATVPMNSFQMQINKSQQNLKKPSYGVQHKVDGVLLKVIDRDAIDLDEIPDIITTALIRAPGRLYGQVKLDSGAILYLPFRDSLEVVYSLYGDAKSIENKRISVIYYDKNIQQGEIVLSGETLLPMTNTSTSVFVYDIGGIF